MTRSWTRTLSRLASLLGQDPRSWIERVGIPWDETTRRVSETSLRGRGRSSVSRLAPAEMPIGNRMRIGLVDRPPFSEPLQELNGSFLETLARRLLKTIDPTVRVRFQAVAEHEAIAELSRPTPGIDMAFGILENAMRLREGLAFAAIPGWNVRLAAVRVAPRGMAPSPQTWDALIKTATDIPLLVSEGSAAHPYLLGGADISGERLQIRSVHDVEGLATALLTEAQRHPGTGAALVTDEATSRQVRTALDRMQLPMDPFDLLEINDAASGAPALPLAIAVTASRTAQITLLEHALRSDLLISAARETARLYGTFAASFHQTIGEFAEADPTFRQTLCAHLVSRVHPPEYARTLVPRAWSPHLDAALRGKLDPHRPSVSDHQCHSCSASLDDGVHGGISDRYCRFCADETGQLRPRDEVHGVIARWLQNWQRGISEPESMRRASIFMSAMPAWSDN